MPAHALLDQAAQWLDAGEATAIATIVHIRGSSSQPLGARMVMTGDHRFVGAVSGGCVETDVYEAAQDVMSAGGAPLMLHYKHVENPLIEIGLNCEGQIDVLVERLDRTLLDLLRASPQDGERVLITLCRPNQPLNPEPVHLLLEADRAASPDLPEAVIAAAQSALERDQPVSVMLDDGRVALCEPVVSPPTLLIFGAVQIAVPLVRLAKILGFRTIVTDARPAYADPARHPDADQVIAAWPKDVIAQVGITRRTYVVSLNHEARFEDALWRALLGQPVRYIGALGKRQRAIERQQRAADSGLDLDQLPFIHTPIGLNLGGRSDEEMALSILAEIVAVRHGRSGGMLSLNGASSGSPQAGSTT